MKQLDLFEWTPSSQARTILPFPQDRRTGEIRRVADLIQKKKGRAAERLWQHQIDQIRRQMTRSGFSADEIEAGVSSFHCAVQSELDRAAWVAGGEKARPGDGAGRR
ncbi:DUF6074 family protein [Mesorhizobium sp. M1340]|uniref:DUF6074 family protein n=1 Tax=unclassified Mesorhizobium TaxID=325217 RepID=UPI00333806EB